MGGEEEEEEEEEEMDEEGGGGNLQHYYLSFEFRYSDHLIILGQKTNYKINNRYEPHPLSDITDPTMSFWVHHTMYILPQGRTKWWDPNPPGAFGVIIYLWSDLNQRSIIPT